MYDVSIPLLALLSNMYSGRACKDRFHMQTRACAQKCVQTYKHTLSHFLTASPPSDKLGAELSQEKIDLTISCLIFLDSAQVHIY